MLPVWDEPQRPSRRKPSLIEVAVVAIIVVVLAVVLYSVATGKGMSYRECHTYQDGTEICQSK